MQKAIKDARIRKGKNTESKYIPHKNRKSIKEMYNDREIVSHDEFVAEWMRQLELRFKKTNDNSESIH